MAIPKSVSKPCHSLASLCGSKGFDSRFKCLNTSTWIKTDERGQPDLSERFRYFLRESLFCNSTNVSMDFFVAMLN